MTYSKYDTDEKKALRYIIYRLVTNKGRSKTIEEYTRNDMFLCYYKNKLNKLLPKHKPYGGKWTCKDIEI